SEPGPILTGGSGGAKVVEQRVSTQRPRRMGPGSEAGTTVKNFSALARIAESPALATTSNKAPPGGGPGGASMSESAAAISGQITQTQLRDHSNATLLDHLDDAARARFDQHGPAVDHGVAIGRDAVLLRDVVIGDAGFRQHAADDDAVRNGVGRHPLANDIFAERRPLVDRDAIGFAADDHRAAG